MSWDVQLKINTGVKEYFVEEVRQVTYNNSKLLHHLKVHHSYNYGKAKDWIVPVREAIQTIWHKREELKTFEPDNNWGGIDDTLDFPQTLERACVKHPECTVEWS